MADRDGTVLVIDDDQDMRWAIRTALAATGLAVVEASSAATGLEIITNHAPDAVLLDMRMPGMCGEELLQRLRRLDRSLPVIVVTGYGTIASAVEAIRTGAFEYITKPFRNEQLLDAVRRAISRRDAGPDGTARGAGAAIVAAMGHGPAIRSLVAQIEAVIDTDYSVLIQGETGTGKEIVARCLHDNGPRARRPLVVVDCGRIVESLTDSELFGAEKGAYTGAISRRRGWFEAAAAGGTLFLDEIGNLAPTGQRALLRALEDRVIHRVGSTTPINVDLRVIAATNEALDECIKNSGFREDLYFRLAEYVITLPPLRARPEDVEYLARRFLHEARDGLGRPAIEIAPAALDLLRGCDWPGNVRELRNVMRRAALTAGDVVTAAHIAACLNRALPTALPPMREEAHNASLRGQVRAKIHEVEREAVLQALERAAGNKAQAARLLGIDYKTYRTKLKSLRRSVEAVGDARE